MMCEPASTRSSTTGRVRCPSSTSFVRAWVVNVGYYRTWYGGFTVTENLAVTAADFDTFCITAPVDSRLPNSGERVCGLYDIKPAAFGLVNNQVTQASNYGKQTQIYNGIDATVNMRFAAAGPPVRGAERRPYGERHLLPE